LHYEITSDYSGTVPKIGVIATNGSGVVRKLFPPTSRCIPPGFTMSPARLVKRVVFMEIVVMDTVTKAS